MGCLGVEAIPNCFELLLICFAQHQLAIFCDCPLLEFFPHQHSSPPSLKFLFHNSLPIKVFQQVKPYSCNLLMIMAEKVAGFTLLKKISLAQSGRRYNRIGCRSFEMLRAFN